MADIALLSNCCVYVYEVCGSYRYCGWFGISFYWFVRKLVLALWFSDNGFQASSIIYSKSQCLSYPPMSQCGSESFRAAIRLGKAQREYLARFIEHPAERPLIS